MSRKTDKVTGGGWLVREDYSKFPGLRGKPSPRESSREEALADWVGEEREAEVFASFRKPEAEIGKILDSWLSTVDVGVINLLEEIKKDWPALVGDVNARQCEPVSLNGQTLQVEVSSGTWMYILKTQQLNIITQRVAQFTQRQVTKVELRPSQNYRQK